MDRLDSLPLQTTQQPSPPEGSIAASASQGDAPKPNTSDATHQLVDNKVLPELAINDDKTASINDGKTASINDGKTASINDGKTASINDGKTASINDGKTASINDGKTASTSAAKIEPKDWTVAIDLTASITTDQGVEDKLAKLKDLAKETQGKSVAFVVHAERLDAVMGLPCELSSTSQDEIKDCSADALKENRAQTENYLIADGKITPLGTKMWASTDQDITSLLEDAAVLAPSKHLGMILQSHGGGADGIETNLGGVTLDDTVGAISQGLKGSGHEKLDLLDYDSCNMADPKVLDASKQVANDVVASEAVEWASKIRGGYDAQNIVKDMRSLLADSTMSGRQLGDEIVRQASADPKDIGDGPGTPTLANFDLTKFGDFQESFDHFGAVLTKASQDGHAQELEKDVSATIVPDTGHDKWKEHGRDLKIFAQKILADSQAGTFGTAGPELAQAANDLLTSMDQMITAHHGDANQGYGQVGGLTAEAPGDEILDSKKLVFHQSQLLKLDGKLNDFQNEGVKLKSQQDYVQAVNDMLQMLPPGVTIEDKDLQQLIKDRDDVAKADSQRELTHSFSALVKDTDAFAAGELELKMEDGLAHSTKSTWEIYFTTDREGVAPNWDAFGNSLKAAEK